MKNEAFKVEFVARRSCFLYFPQHWLSKLTLIDSNSSKICLLMSSGVGNNSYFSTSVQPYVSTTNEQSVGINATYAKILGLKENEEVLITNFPYAAPVKKIYVSLVSVTDWEILEMNMTEIQASLLDQVRIVCPGQTFVVWVSKNLHFCLRVGALHPNLEVGMLETFTDLVFTNPSIDSDTRSVSRINNRPNEQAGSNTSLPKTNCLAVNNNDQQPRSNTGQETNAFNIWETFKNKLFPSLIQEFEDHHLEQSITQHNVLPNTSTLNMDEWRETVVSHSYRVNPLELDKFQPSNATDVLLTHPFNIFINKGNLPSSCCNINGAFEVILCRVSVVPSECLMNRKERDKSENLKQKQNPCEENATLNKIKPVHGIYARVIAIEDMYKNLSNEARNMCKNFTSRCAYKHVLISESMRRALKIDVGCRLELTVEKCEKKEASTVEIIPLETSNNDIKALFITCVKNLVKNSSLLLNAGAVIPIPLIGTTNTIEILIRVISPVQDYYLFDSNFVQKTNFIVRKKTISVAENYKIAVASVSNSPKILSCAKRSLVNEGLATVEMDLNLRPSTRVYTKPFASSNVLIVGQAGSGKTTLARRLCKEVKCSPHFVHCVDVQCTHLKGKMVETLQKKLNAWIDDCVYHQPSILFLDDIDAILGISPAEEEGSQQDVQSLRVCEMLTEAIQEAQHSNYVMVIATTLSLSKLSSSVASPRGQHFFKVILEIAELTKEDRRETMKELLLLKTGSLPTQLKTIDLESHASKTEGYVVQDLVDMADKAIFEAWKRKLSDGTTEIVLEDSDMIDAISNTVPLSLQGVTLFKDATHTWDDVGGLAEVKSTLIEVLQWPSQYMDLYASCPLRLQTGLLLFGAPGTGKTLLAAAVAHECGLNFISVKGPELLSKYIGASEEGVRNIFHKAQSARPCVLFFDEFDSLAPRRGHDSTGVTDRVVNQLLTQLDGVESLIGVWVVAATSRPDLLDPALLRPGRLDKAVLCPMPDAADRLEILKAQSRKMRLAASVDLEDVAVLGDGFTGADLQAVLYTAQVAALEEASQTFMTSQEIADQDSSKVLIEVTQAHLLAALADTRPSLPLEEKLRYQRIYEKFVGSRSGKRKEVEFIQQRTTLA